MSDSGKSEEKKLEGKGVLYLGEDEGFWRDVVEGFKTFKQISFDFSLQYEKEPEKIQNFVNLIQKDRPRVVFIDLAKNTEEMLHLLRAQIRMNSPHHPFIIALTAYTQGEEVKRQAIMAGAQCVHVKSGEIEAVVYDAICFAFHNALEDHGFAMAKFSEDVKAYVPAKASVVSPRGLRIESNYSIKEGEKYMLNTFWSEQEFLKSSLSTASSQTSKDLFYNFQYAQEFGFEFVNPVEIQEDAKPEEVEKLKQEKLKELSESQQDMLKWIEENQSRSHPKLIKILVIDKELTLYTDQPLTDSYPFIIRAQPYLKQVKKELQQLMPQMIVFQMEEVDQEEVDSDAEMAHMYNENKNLQHLIKVIKSIGNFEPFVVVFNSEHDTPKLQDVLNYGQIIGYKEALSSDLMLKMAQMLQKKLYGDQEAFGPNIVVLDKRLPCTYVEFETNISLLACSENDVYFNCEEDFEVGTALRLQEPANLFITVAEPPKNPKADAKYYALVNGIGEEEKKELRKFINSVFFREKEMSKQKEREEVEKTKQKYIEKQKSEQQKKEEAAAKRKEEEKQREEEKKKAEQKAKNEAAASEEANGDSKGEEPA